jgi:hypothetical protein
MLRVTFALASTGSRQFPSGDVPELLVGLVVPLDCWEVVNGGAVVELAVVADVVAPPYWNTVASAPNVMTRPTTTEANTQTCVLAPRTFQSR